ncbi:MAG: type VI secretion system baseplate subunit TssG [Alphaproteobacteria bacterium]|nr:type VI secretion system baseplate subunit TssG [Alphaproteobacteria bacterium]
MEAAARNTNYTVKQNLRAHTYQFDFHQAVELLQQMLPDSTPLGEGSNPTQEAVRIKSRVSLSPASSEIHSFSLPKPYENQPILWINFMGIAGVQGPLPTPYTELVMERSSKHDYAFRDFLDIFNHRYASLWHRLKKRTFISYSQKDPTKTHIGKCLLSVCGLGNQALRNKVFVSDRTLLSYHDLLWKRPRTPYGLVKILSTHFQLPVTVHQYQGAWVVAPDSEITRLGTRQNQMNALGTQTILGRKIWNQAAGIRIDIGPMNWKELQQLIPAQIKNHQGEILTGHFNQSLRDLSLFYIGIDYHVKFRLKIHGHSIKPLRLNRQFSLGHHTWLTTGKPLNKDYFVDITCHETY